MAQYGRFLAMAIFLLGLGLTALAWRYTVLVVEHDREQSFYSQVIYAQETLNRRVQSLTEVLYGIQGFVTQQPDLSRAGFRRYVMANGFLDRLPGIQVAGLARVVPAVNKVAYENSVRTDTSLDPNGYRHFSVRPPGDRAEYVVITYVEPMLGNEKAFGFDFGSEAVRRLAVETARDSGEAAATGGITLVQESGTQTGFLLMAPVYRIGMLTQTPEQRRQAFLGLTYFGFRMGDLIQQSYSDRILEKMDLVIYDSLQAGGSAGKPVLFDSRQAVDQTEKNSSASQRLRREATLEVGGHVWRLVFYSKQSASISTAKMPLVVLASGGLITLLLTWVFLILSSSNRRAIDLAGQISIRLHDTEVRSHAVLENVIEGIITIGERGVVESFNKAAEVIFGYTAAEVIGNNVKMLMPEPYHSQHDGYLHNYVSTGNKKIIGIGREVSGLRKDGSTFPLDLSVTEMHVNGQRIFTGVVRDISQRKAAEEVLARVSGINQAILDNADHSIIATDTEGLILIFNHAAERMLGYRAEEMVGKLTPAILHDPDEVGQRAEALVAVGVGVEPGFEVFVALSRQGLADTNEWSYIRKDGTRFPVSLTVTALHDERGKITGYLGIATDITERKRDMQVRRDGEARLAAILDNVLDSIITISELGIVESFNKTSEKIFGYAASEVIGNNIKMLMPEPYHGQHDGYLHNYVSTGNKKIIGIGRQVVGQRKDGSIFPMDLAVSEMRLGDKRMFTGIVRDITERVKTERMKTEFISTVSHELRTPLTSIRGSLGLIAGGVAGVLSPQLKALVDIAHKNSERLILLVNDILDMEKIESGKIEFQLKPVELMPLLHQALESNRAYGEQFDVSYELESDLPGVMLNVDANRLMQILANLLSNAAKFSPAGDKVMVDVTRLGNHIRVAVKDHGSGIPEQFRDRIFQKFAQADSSDTRKKGGTGLGLSITKAIVEQMGGSIGFDSEPDVLTTFFVEFPIWQETTIFASGLMEGRKRVLICEDDHDIAALLLLMLEQNGLAADIAYDAVQAKQMLAQGEYVAMTLDLALPDQDGISLIRELRNTKETAALPILVVSAKAVEGRQEVDGEALSVIDWISKPINQDQLILALKQVVGKADNGQPRVLQVEDDLDIFRVVQSIVGDVAHLDHASTLTEARQLLGQYRYDLVILDLGLPDGSGKDLLPLLNGASPPIPVMVFSASEMGLEGAREVDNALVKARTSNEVLLATIKQLIGVA